MSRDLDADFARILDGQATLEETKAFLAASVGRMGDPEALAAGARAMRARMIPVVAPEHAIDVCGTGGDGAHTLNISTAVAFVVAGAGVPVAKHGNRAMSSKTGTADVLEALGVKLTADLPTLERCLTEANIAFLFAQNHHPAMRHVAQARREFGHRTIFNLLGPLSNPARVKRQLVGVFAREFVDPVVEAIAMLGAERALVVHGSGGLDELSAAGKEANDVAELGNDTITRQTASMDAPVNAELAGGTAAENAAELRALLEGRGRAGYRAAVLINAAAALYIGRPALSIEYAHVLAAEAIESGAALAQLKRLVELTRDAP